MFDAKIVRKLHHLRIIQTNCPIRLLGWQGAKKLLENGGRLSRREFRGGFERDDYYKYEFFNYC